MSWMESSEHGERQSLRVKSDIASDWNLTATMLFPDDEQMRRLYAGRSSVTRVSEALGKALEALQGSTVARGAIGARGAPIDSDETVPFSIIQQRCVPSVQEAVRLIDGVDGRSLLLNAPAKATDEQVYIGIGNGVLAGLCLIYYYVLNNNRFMTAGNRPAEASKGLVEFIAEKHNLGRKRGRRGRPSQEDSRHFYQTVDMPLAGTIWSRYRSVAHLWAAWLTCREVLDMPVAESIWTNISSRAFVDHASRYVNFSKGFFNGTTVGNSHREIFFPISVDSDDCVCTWEKKGIQVPCNLLTVVGEYARTYKSGTKYLSSKQPF